jgi:hypothetical protein
LLYCFYGVDSHVTESVSDASIAPCVSEEEVPELAAAQ